MKIPIIRNYWRWLNASIGIWIIAWGFGFLRYLGDSSVEFPIWPNLLDVIGLILVGSYLFVRELRPH
jgi:hypothetical protein